MSFQFCDYLPQRGCPPVGVVDCPTDALEQFDMRPIDPLKVILRRSIGVVVDKPICGEVIRRVDRVFFKI
jgi:hypothetical protein